jgi:hypothetical protein
MPALEEEFQNLKKEYAEKAARGTAMSEHDRYKRKLDELRRKLRAKKHSHLLGEILLDMGVIDEEGLSQALEEQRTKSKEKLLGEILVDRGWVGEGMIDRAIRRQIKLESGGDKMDKSEVD